MSGADIAAVAFARAAGARDRIAHYRRAMVDAAARADMARALCGIDADSWGCPDCAQPWSYPSRWCQCGRPYPTACAQRGCLASVEPIAAERGAWLCTPYCDRCSGDAERQARAAIYAAANVPPREARISAQAFAPLAGQEVAHAAIVRWVCSALAEPLALYFAGSPGIGKSVLAAYAARFAFVDNGLCTDFRWHSQAGLQALFAARHGDDAERGAAIAGWQRAERCGFLVLDDLFSDPLTPAFAAAVQQLVRERLDHARPTVITSNHPPDWSSRFPHDAGRLASRWRGYGREIVIRGNDHRAQRGNA